MITIPIGRDQNGKPEIPCSKREDLFSDGYAGVAFGIALMQTAGREDLLVKYGSAIEDLVGNRPRPEFREADADNYMYVGVKPDSEQMVKRKSYVYGERWAL